MKSSAAVRKPVSRLKAAWSKPITENERAWIEFIRLASRDSDPAPTLEMVQQVRLLFSTLARR